MKKGDKLIKALIYGIAIIFGITIIITNGITTSVTVALFGLIIALFVVDNSSGE